MCSVAVDSKSICSIPALLLSSVSESDSGSLSSRRRLADVRELLPEALTTGEAGKVSLDLWLGAEEDMRFVIVIVVDGCATSESHRMGVEEGRRVETETQEIEFFCEMGCTPTLRDRFETVSGLIDGRRRKFMAENGGGWSEMIWNFNLLRSAL
jgi:hypothetical protein